MNILACAMNTVKKVSSGAFSKVLTELVRVTFKPGYIFYDRKECYKLIKSLNMKAPFTLDIGCADGRMTLFYKELLGDVIGVDINLAGLKVAKTKDINAVCADAKMLPFRDNSFCLITAFQILEHIDEDLVFINETYRVLNFRAYAIITTPNRTRFNNIIYESFLKSLVKCPVTPPDHVFEYTFTNLKSLMERSNSKSGYRIVPIGLVRIPWLQISTVPSLLSRYSDQLILILRRSFRSPLTLTQKAPSIQDNKRSV